MECSESDVNLGHDDHAEELNEPAVMLNAIPEAIPDHAEELNQPVMLNAIPEDIPVQEEMYKTLSLSDITGRLYILPDDANMFLNDMYYRLGEDGAPVMREIEVFDGVNTVTLSVEIPGGNHVYEGGGLYIKQKPWTRYLRHLGVRENDAVFFRAPALNGDRTFLIQFERPGHVLQIPPNVFVYR